MPKTSNDPRPLLRIVPDTGFYIAATLKSGFARSYLVGKGAKFLRYELYSSEAILLELQEKLEGKFAIPRLQAVQVITGIRKVISVVHPEVKLQVVRDKTDDKILECAIQAKAQVVVSFDKDLLSLKEFEGIQIVHPSTLKYLLPL